MATKKQASSSVNRNSITAADVLAGAVIPMNVTLNITIRSGTGREPLEILLARHVPQIMKWAAGSPDNARLLIVDPVTAVARSGAKLTRAEQIALEQKLGRRTMTEILPPAAQLTRLDVSVAQPPKGGRRG
ncbi:MAG TPA: hypothetical protein VG323_10605 [Thermoanaerobaculia bacterium]|nr:hypothetical protein [Thermoanaerobaculia bacterium]